MRKAGARLSLAEPAVSSPRYLALRPTGSSILNTAPFTLPTSPTTANYEVRLYEGQSRYDVIYGTVASGNSSATAGVQKTTDFDQYFCNGSGGAATGGQSYILQSCGTPTPTPTASPSATPTAAATATPTAPATATPTATVAVTPTPTGTPACIVVNGGFETGSLPPWLDTGDTSFTGVGAPAIPHSGAFALFSGPSTSDGFVDQVLPTVAGQGYDVTFWLQNTDTSNDQSFWGYFWECYSRTGGRSERLWVYAIYFYQCDTRSQR